MAKVAVVVFANTETHEGLARVHNALEVAKEFKEAGDEVRLVFDGAGTQALATLVDPEHRAHALFKTVRDTVAGACRFCAAAFGVKDRLESAGIPLLDEYDQHPSLRRLVVEGYQVLTF